MILLFVAIADMNALQCFMYGTGLFENFCFLIGSAYFVAGSYPEDEEGDDMEAGRSKGSKKKHAGNIGETFTTPFIEAQDKDNM